MLKCIEKLNKRIEQQGYSFKNLPPVWKEKYTSVILVILIVKAILNLFGLEKDEGEDEKTNKKESSAFTAKFYNLFCQFQHKFFLVRKFATSL